MCQTQHTTHSSWSRATCVNAWDEMTWQMRSISHVVPHTASLVATFPEQQYESNSTVEGHRPPPLQLSAPISIECTRKSHKHHKHQHTAPCETCDLEVPNTCPREGDVWIRKCYLYFTCIHRMGSMHHLVLTSYRKRGRPLLLASAGSERDTGRACSTAPAPDAASLLTC